MQNFLNHPHFLGHERCESVHPDFRGVLSLTYHLAASGAPHRIRANAILPGLIRTPSTQFLFRSDDSPGTRMGAANPLGRAGEPDDVAKVALFLASDDSWYVNAAAIPVDGGQSVIV